MTDPGRRNGPVSAERPLGEIVTDVSDQVSLLVHEEIELAKAEVFGKLKSLGAGAAVAAAAGVFVVFGLIYGFMALAFAINELFGWVDWPGFAIVWLLLTVLGAIAGLVAYRLFKAGAPPVPKQAIEEAKLTKAEIDRVRAG